MSLFGEMSSQKEVIYLEKKKLRYAILKEIDSGNNKLSEDDFGIDENTFDDTVNYLKREKYLDGIPYADGRPLLHEGSAYLTERGEDYLLENSRLAKTYKGLKEIRDWLKF